MKKKDWLFPSVRNMHFVGIGGIGMSGIAEVMLNLGYSVSGSDIRQTELTRRLSALGAKIYPGHSPGNLKSAQVVVVSSAISEKNPEVIRARRMNIPVIPRAVMLAELGRMKKTVTIAGSHGKTTTAAMTAMALQAAGADPTVITGGIIKNIGSNARLGAGDYFVAEADESDGSFVHFSPLAAIVTNIDSDHLDYFGNMNNLKKAFLRHLSRVPFYGSVIICADDSQASALIPKIEVPLISYGIRKNADWIARKIRMDASGAVFEAWFHGRRAGEVRISIPGEYNVLNSLAALACGSFLGFKFAGLARGLKGFCGVGRRLEKLGEASGMLFMDDYAHHPTEITAVIKAVSGNFKYERLVIIFQPHRFSRTKLVHRKMGAAFKGADMVYVMDIYPAGEKPLKGVNSSLVLDSLKKSRVPAIPFTRAVDVTRDLKAGDLILTIGAGDVWKVGEELKRRSTASIF